MGSIAFLAIRLSHFVVFCRPLWARAGEGAGDGTGYWMLDGRCGIAGGKRLSAMTCDDLKLSKFEISGKVICRQHRISREKKRTEAAVLKTPHCKRWRDGAGFGTGVSVLAGEIL